MMADGSNSKNNRDNGTMNIWSFAAKLWILTVVLGLSTFVVVRARSYRAVAKDLDYLENNQRETNLRGRLDASILDDVQSIEDTQVDAQAIP